MGSEMFRVEIISRAGRKWIDVEVPDDALDEDANRDWENMADDDTPLTKYITEAVRKEHGMVSIGGYSLKADAPKERTKSKFPGSQVT